LAGFRPDHGRVISDLSHAGQYALEIAAVSSGARVVLLLLLGLLLVVLGVLITIAVVMRRKNNTSTVTAATHAEVRAALRARTGSGGVSVSADGTSSGVVAFVSEESRVACPTCSQEYDGALNFCPADSRELVPVSEFVERAREGSCACVTCHRAFEAGVRYCPDDASELVPIAVYEATHGRVGHLAPLGVRGRICSQCQRRVDLAARFCPFDGNELSLLH